MGGGEGGNQTGWGRWGVGVNALESCCTVIMIKCTELTMEKILQYYCVSSCIYRVDEVVVYLNDTLDLLLEYLIDVRSIIQEDLLITAGELYIYCLRCIKLRSAPDVADVNRKIESYLMTLVNYLKSWLRDGWQKPRRWPRHFTFGKPDEWKVRYYILLKGSPVNIQYVHSKILNNT